MNKLPLNVWILTIAQALMMSVSSIVVFVGGLIGTELAPASNLATLPVATIIIGTAATVIPVTSMMKKLGRKRAFLIVCVYSMLISLLSALAIGISSFFLLCISFFLFGVPVVTLMQFRFAAMESVSADQVPNAASAALIGGIAAAFIGPEVAVFGKDLLPTQYVGSFVLLAGLFFLSFLILLKFKNPITSEEHSDANQRSLKQICGQRIFWVAMLSAAVGYVVMSFIMTATPVSMHVMDGHSLEDTKVVIQSHIMSMFLPSLAAGWIIKKIGIKKMMVLGLLAYLVCIVIAYSGHSFSNYWVSLIFLGLGWNFLFVAGTTLLPQSYKSHERFKVQALNDSIVFGSQALAALSAGWLVFEFGWETILLFTIPLIFFQLGVIRSFTLKKPSVK